MPKLQPKEIRQNGHVDIQRMAWKVPYILGCIEYHKSFKRFTDDIRNIVYLWNIYEVLTAQRRTLSQRLIANLLTEEHKKSEFVQIMHALHKLERQNEELSTRISALEQQLHKNEREKNKD